MLATLVLGFVLGMQHATEADHVAAVANLASGQTRPRMFLLHGASWGLGHGLMLLIVVSALLVFNGLIPGQIAVWLDFGVGLMLAGLGLHVLVRLLRQHMHFHLHRHRSVSLHFLPHSHEAGLLFQDAHAHRQDIRLPLRTFVVGLMHGMAGSAALAVVSAASIGTLPGALTFVALFGLGSALGMAVLSAIISVPLSLSARLPKGAFSGIQGLVGFMTLGIGLHIMLTQCAASGAN